MPRLRYTNRKVRDDRPIVRICRACQAEIPKTETAYLRIDPDRDPDEWGPWCAPCAEQRGQTPDS